MKKVWRKQTVRYVVATTGKKTTKTDPHATKQKIESKRFYGTLVASDGKRKQVPLTEHEDSAVTLLVRLQVEADKDRALGITPSERKKDEPLKTWIEKYEIYLRSQSRSNQHVDMVVKRSKLLFGVSKITTLENIDPSKLLTTIYAWRKNGKIEGGKGKKKRIPSLETCNHYIRSVKAFTRWLWQEKVLVEEPLRGLKIFNSNIERAKVRRSMTEQELQTLITHTKTAKTYGGKRWRLTGNQRSLLYLLAATTGLRASELASLKRSSIDMEQGTVTVKACAAKNKKTDTLPLTNHVLAELATYLESLPLDGYLFPGSWALDREGGVLFKRDALRAAITITNDDGESLDFHALRTSFITCLARSGVHPSTAQRLARHSTITLTMNTYTKLGGDVSLREAVERLPSYGCNPK